MIARWLAVGLWLCSPALWGQHGTTPKGSPADYPVHGKLGEIELGAEYLVHSVWSDGQTYFVPGYLVVEVAVYPPKHQTIDVATAHFALRINGKKGDGLAPAAPELVAFALKYPDPQQQRGLQTTGQMGPIILGPSTTTQGRFPGDPQAPPTPPAPPVPDQNAAGIEKPPVRPADQAVVDAALPVGDASGPVAGHLYFAYQGRLKSLKSLELIYRSATGQVVLPLL
ncbi:MAG: hypothetical protein ACLQGV_12190 [Bryobacteraceae bacterium]